MYNVIDFIKPQIFNQRVISPYTKYKIIRSNEHGICNILKVGEKTCDGSGHNYEGVCICFERHGRIEKISSFMDNLITTCPIAVMIQLPDYPNYIILSQTSYTTFKQQISKRYISHYELYKICIESQTSMSSHISLVLNNIKSGKYNEDNNI